MRQERSTKAATSHWRGVPRFIVLALCEKHVLPLITITFQVLVVKDMSEASCNENSGPRDTSSDACDRFYSLGRRKPEKIEHNSTNRPMNQPAVKETRLGNRQVVSTINRSTKEVLKQDLQSSSLTCARVEHRRTRNQI